MGKRIVIGALSFVGYVGTVLGANWAITRFGIVPVGFGLMAPAGVYFAGLAFSLRDATQETLGRLWAIAAILVGAAVSTLIDPALGVASGAAFLVSEFADFAVYTPLRRRNYLAAVGLSNTVGAVLDSAVFLWLAFGSLDFMVGQVWGKLLMTLPVVAVLYLVRYRLPVAKGA